MKNWLRALNGCDSRMNYAICNNGTFLKVPLFLQGGIAIEQFRFCQVLRLLGINKQATAAFDQIDDFPVFFLRNCRATPTATYAAGAGQLFIHIWRSVHYNRTAEGIVIKSFFKPYQLKRIAIATHICIAGNIKAKAALQRRRLVGKLHRHTVATVASVGNPGMFQNLACSHVNDVKPTPCSYRLWSICLFLPGLLL
jgi:hypothetical protein